MVFLVDLNYFKKPVMKRLIIAALLCLGFLPVSVRAETTLTLSQSFELAKKNNLEFQALQKEAQAVEGDLIQAGLIPNPTLELEYKSNTPFSGLEEGEQGVFLSQELELGWKRSARMSVSRSALEGARFKVEDKARQLRQQVRALFYETWVAQQRRTVLEEIANNQKRLLDLNESRVKLGAIPGLEVKLVKAEYLRIQQKMEETRKEAENTLANFLQLIGAPPDEKLNLQIPNALRLALPDIDSLLSQALQKRPDLKAQEKVIHKSEAQIRLEKSQAFPNLTVGGGVIWDKTFVEAKGITPGGIISQINDRDTLYQIRFSVPLPLFNRNQGNILKAERLYETELLKQQNLKRTIQTEVITAWQSVAADQREQERFEKELLPAVKENADIIEKAYLLGGESVLAVIQAERTLFETQLDYLDNVIQLQKSTALLESAVGMELP